MLLKHINYIWITAFIITSSIVYYRIAKWLNISDQPIGRSSHTASTITALGIIFPLAIIFSSILVKSTPPISPLFILGLIGLSIISFIDDVFFVKHSIRFIFQIVCLLLMMLDFPLGENYVALIPIYAAAIVFGIGVINAYNFMDGINGMLGLNLLATLICLILLNDFIPSAVTNGLPMHFIDSRILYSVLAADVVFLFYNFRRKAISFAGDVGAISIGFTVLYIIYQLILSSQNFTYLLLFIVLGIDAGVTVFYKIILRENIFVPHRDFLFKKLVHIAKMPHLRVSTIYATVQLIIGIITLTFFKNIPITSQIAVIFTAIVGLVAAYIYYRNRLTKKRHEKPVSKPGKLKTIYKKIS